MARVAKTKKATPEEQLVKLNEQIEKTSATLKELKKQKIQLEKNIKNGQILELTEIIAESGLSIEDVRQMLSEKQKKVTK